MGQRHVGLSQSSPQARKCSSGPRGPVQCLQGASLLLGLLSAVLMVLTCHSMSHWTWGNGGRMWSSLCGGAGETEQAPQMKRAGHCLLRAGTVAHTEISALVGVHIETGQTWLLPCTERDTF